MLRFPYKLRVLFSQVREGSTYFRMILNMPMKVTSGTHNPSHLLRIGGCRNMAMDLTLLGPGCTPALQIRKPKKLSFRQAISHFDMFSLTPA